MTEYMSNSSRIKKLGADKVALLGIFAVALLTARLIVAMKSALVLSEPIELTHSGLSVSMPTGNGWRSEEKWSYQENIFTLSSIFTAGSGTTTAWVQYQYQLAAETISPQAWFAQKASDVDGAIVETGQTTADTLTIDWAHIRKPEILLSTFLGTAELPSDRRLNIEVHQITSDTNPAEQTFKQIIKTLRFEDNHMLEAGAEIIAEIKSEGLNSLLDNRNQQTLFLIKDSRGSIIGFSMDVLVDSNNEAQPNIQGAGLFYTRGRYGSEQVVSFQSNNNLDEFAYKSETHDSAGRRRVDIIVEEVGVMTIRKSDARLEKKIYRFSPTAIPNILLDQLLRQMLDSSKKKIIVDIIEANGKITPTLISAIEVREGAIASQEPAYVIKLELLDGRGFSEHTYFDDKKRIYKKLVQQDDIYILQGATVKDVASEFPERAEYILQRNKMLE